MYYTNFFYPIFVKKSEASYLFKRNKFFLGLVSFGLAIILAAISFTVLPKLFTIFSENNLTVPLFTAFYQKYYIYGILGIIMFSFYIISPNRYDEIFQNKLSKYNDQESILVSDLLRNNLNTIVIALITIFVLSIIFAIISPIYDLTSQI